MIKRFIVLSLSITCAASAALATPVDTVKTTKCQFITRHVPDSDVAFQPGRDVVAGKPVAPADLQGSSAVIDTPQAFDIEIDVDLQNSVNSDSEVPPGFEPRAKIGKVQVRELEGETALDFDGKPLYRGAPGTTAPDCAQ